MLVEARKQVKSNVQRRLGVVHQVAHDRIVLHEFATHRDQPQHFVVQVGHGREGFHLAVGDARRLQHGPLNHLAGVADQGHALLTVALERQLHPLGHAHMRKPLQQRLPFNQVGFGGGHSLLERGRVALLLQQLLQLQALLGGKEGRSRQRRSQRRGRAQPVEIRHQPLQDRSRHVGNRCGQQLRRAVRVVGERAGHARSVDQVFGAKLEQLWRSIRPRQRGGKSRFRLRKQRPRGAFSDQFVGVRRQHSQ